MPLCKGKGCSAAAGKIIAYVTQKKKAEIVSSYALDDSRSYAMQFRETQDLYEKAQTFESRKYYHFVNSFDPAEKISPEEAHKMTKELAVVSFPGHEYVIATHTDKAHIHCHVVVNSVSFETGKMMHLNNKEYTRIKDRSNEIAQEHGHAPLDFRKSSKTRLTTAEKRIELKGGKSWKQELRDVIDVAMASVDNSKGFFEWLERYGVKSRVTNKTISFLHPKKTQPIRGDRLGADYTKEGIERSFSLNHSPIKQAPVPAKSNLDRLLEIAAEKARKGNEEDARNTKPRQRNREDDLER